MNSSTFQSRPSRASSSGVALVIVLAGLVLLVGLVLAFFVSVTGERATAQRFEDSVSSQLLVDTAVNSVIGQIRQATSNSELAWASQPGAIRTFQADGTLSSVFKLYSSPTMKIANASALTNDLPPGTWAASPSEWTDLNEPVTVTRGGSQNTYYPIVDPSAEGSVEGFSLNSPPGATTDQPLPMPTRWIYVLRDGQLTSTTGTGPTPTAANPITGRIAFWTDDDTTKLNVNTAGGSVAWDVPRAQTSFDFNQGAQFPPAAREVQRFPGHPATTDLRTVFPDLTHEEIAGIIPRIQWGGSEGGTKNSGSSNFASILYDEDRLYNSVDEVIFQPDRQSSADGTSVTTPTFNANIERTRFFLTPYNRAPEVNLFNMPRVTIWPISDRIATAQEANFTTAFDRSIAFVSQIGSTNDIPHDYFFKRQNAYSRNADWDNIPRNRELLGYLFHLTSRPVPGFGGAFRTKYGETPTNPMPRDRLLISIFDYIRSTNIADPSVNTPYTIPRGPSDPPPGFGQVVPSVINVTSLPGASTLTDARGLGRFLTVSDAGLWFIGVGDALSPVSGTSPEDIILLAGLDGVPGNADDLIQVQAVFIAQFFDPSSGFPVLRPNFTMRVQALHNLQFEQEGAWVSMGFPQTASMHMNAYTPFYHHGNALGGIQDIRLMTRYFPDPTSFPGNNVPRALAAGPAGYPFFSNVLKVPKAGPMKFRVDPTGNPAQITLFNGNSTDAAQQVQAITQLQFTNSVYAEVVTPPPAIPESPSAQRAVWLTGDGVNAAAGSGYNSFLKRFQKVSGGNWNFLMDGQTSATAQNFGGGVPANTSEIRDVVRTFVINPDRADGRVVAINQVNTMGQVQSNGNEMAWRAFNYHPLYKDTSVRMAHSFRTGLGWNFSGGGGGFFVRPAGFNATATYNSPYLPQAPRDLFAAQPGNFDYAIQPFGGSPGMRPGAAPGDWDIGVGRMADGSFANKPDEGAFVTAGGSVPYFQSPQVYTSLPSAHFSPNRQVPSAVMFGSLPGGIFSRQVPYRSLLFRPDPLEGTNGSHYGSLPPKDHLLLDLFHMPIVEPYALSEPFSTAGKVNMNYQIQPFTYITRSTGVRAVLKSERLLIVPNSEITVSGANVSAPYKEGSNRPLRFPINLNETLTQFNERFTANDIFRSASEICDIHLVPDDGTTVVANMRNFANFWETRLLTGDNARERPYANIYPRLTTKSNTFTVHYRVQSLRKVPGTNVAQWDETRDQVVGEFRGSTTIERFIDPNDAGIPDYGNAADPFSLPGLDTFYQFRVLGTRQFAP